MINCILCGDETDNPKREGHTNDALTHEWMTVAVSISGAKQSGGPKFLKNVDYRHTTSPKILGPVCPKCGFNIASGRVTFSLRPYQAMS
jgi:hypothetical protein